MLKIILSRQGKKKQPIFRLLVLEKTKDPWGKYLENLGNYNPRTKLVEFKVDRIKHWIAQGAQPSITVWNLLVSKGVVEGKKLKNSVITKRRATKIAGKKKTAEAAAPAAEEPKKE
jgi:small subunit ribosomal protein S16